MKRVLVLLLLPWLLMAASQPETKPRKASWWKVSLAAVAAATAVDAASSWGRVEANPLLRNADGRFGIQGVAIKAAVLGGVAGAQYLLLRNHPKEQKYATLTNFALSGVLSGAAISNVQRAAKK